MKTLINGLALLARTQVGPFSEGGDPAFLMAFRSLSVFQSTPPRRGRRMGRGRLCALQTCFNPRPREGGDKWVLVEDRRWDRVSIHAPAKGATRAPHPRSTAPCRFQSTPPRRGRPADMGSMPEQVQVSIHAPAKGATAIGAVEAADVVVSIHAPAKGATRQGDLPWRNQFLFQSTPPRRGRQVREGGG